VRVSFLHGDPFDFSSNRLRVLNLSTFGPSPVRRFRVTRHLRRISQDDALLEQEGLGQRLTLPELQEALDERGLYVILVSSQTCADHPAQRDIKAISRGHARQSQGMALSRETGGGGPSVGACANNRGAPCRTTLRGQGIMQKHRSP
jgi:hypothetical protein